MTARRTETRSCSFSESFSLAMSRQSWRKRSTLYTKLVLPRIGTFSYKMEGEGNTGISVLYRTEVVTPGHAVNGASFRRLDARRRSPHPFVTYGNMNDAVEIP